MLSIKRFLGFLDRLTLSQKYWAIVIMGWGALFIFGSSWAAIRNYTYLFFLLPAILNFNFYSFKIWANQLGVMFLLGLLAYIALRAIYAADWKSLLAVFLIFIFYFSVVRIPVPSTRAVFLFSGAFTLFLLGYVAIDALVKFERSVWRYGDRLLDLSGAIQNPIHVTMMLVTFLGVYTYSGVALKKFFWVGVVNLLAIFAALMILQTRSFIPAWLSLLVLTGYQVYKFRGKIKWFGLTLFALSFGFLYLLLFQTDVGLSLINRADSHRQEIWFAYLAEVRNCGLLFGCGLDHSFAYISPNIGRVWHAHNFYLEQLYNFGLVGLGLLLALIIYALFQSTLGVSWAKGGIIPLVFLIFFDRFHFIDRPSLAWILLHFPLAIMLRVPR
jgi:hypothetical protein